MTRPAMRPAIKLTPELTPRGPRCARRSPPCYRSEPWADLGPDRRRGDLRDRATVIREAHVERHLHRGPADARCRSWKQARETVDVHRERHQLPDDLRVIDADPELARALWIR